jgi:hypothetical protein
MKGQEENQMKRSKTIVWKRKEGKTWKKDREWIAEERNQVAKKNGRVQFQVGYERKEGAEWRKGRKDRKELEVSRTIPEFSGWDRDPSRETWKNLQERRKKEREAICEKVKERSVKKPNRSIMDGKKVSLEKDGSEWKEQVARVGTGYRVRKDEKDPRKRRFDVGYADLKTYKRKEGRDAVVESSNIGRTVVGKGKDARVKVMNAVCEMEKRRPASEYTGSGILRKSRVGKLKLKPTKPSGKE